jgi:type II secretory pathway component PulF
VKTLQPIQVVSSRPRQPAGNAERPQQPAGSAQVGEAAALRLTAKERLALLERFSTLVDSGIQIAAALQCMRLQDPQPRVAAVLAALEQAVVAGLPLSSAMAAMPRAFPPLLVQVVRTGETTSNINSCVIIFNNNR